MWITGTETDSVEPIVKMLAKLFPKREAYALDYATIMRFLSNRSVFESVFADVSKDMEDMYKFRHTTLGLRNSLTGSFHSLFRVLDRASTNGVGCGFPMSHEDIVIRPGGKIAIQNVTLTGNAANLFGAIVSRGYLFKDETGPSHGEYAHTLQWLTIAYAKYHGVISLENGVVDLYRSAAGPGTLPTPKVRTLDPETDLLIERAAPVWAYLVDCFRSSELHGLPEDFGVNLFVENYRSPSYLTDQMLYRRLRQTFLGKHIQQRYAKRNITTGTKSRIGLRSTWLEKQSTKKEAIQYEGATTNTLAPNRKDLDALIQDLRARTTQFDGSTKTFGGTT